MGWQPTVVAADAPSYWARDETLLDRVPNTIDVHRAREGWGAFGYAHLRRLVPRSQRAWFDSAILVPDRQAPWFWGAVRTALRAARHGHPEVVFATGAPWTSLLVGAVVARRLGVPLVTDFRDPWTDSTVFAPASRLHGTAHRALESWVHGRAHHVVANTEGNLKQLRASFPGTSDKSSFIPNGWDELDFDGLELCSPLDGKLWVGYAGNFYAGRGPREVLSLFAAVRRSPQLRSKLRLRFIGHTDAGAATRELGMEGLVEELGYRPLQEALGLLAGCDVSLVTVPAAARRGWVPQKLYQQLRLGRPVLTLAPPGDAAEITREAGQLWVNLKAPAPEQQLEQALAAVLEGRVASPPASVVGRYDRSFLTRQLARLLDAVTTS